MKRIVHPKPHTSQEEVDKYWNRKFNITSFLFDKQLAFVQDPEPFKVAVCSRRAGKSVGCVADLLDTALNNKDVVCLYITLSAANAKKLVWKEFKKIIKECGLDKDVGMNEVDLSISILKNGSMIYLSGAKDKSEIEKFRGLAIKKCYIDECQAFRSYIQDLIDDIIAPALLDHAGSLCLIGTPGPVPAGFFYDCAVKSDTWSKHGWTYFDNPHIPIKSGKTHQQGLDRELKRRGVTADAPSIQREFFGKWVLDSDSLLIKYTERINNFQGLDPKIKYDYVLGVDLGFNDADALAVLAWSEQDPVTYLIEELVTEKQGISELVAQIEIMRKKYDFSKIVMDMGGLGKKIGEEIIRRYLLPVEAAEKSRKMENVELLNDALRSGRFKAKGDSIFAQDSYKVEIDRDKSTPERIVVSSRYHSDIIDAVLYGFKLSPAYSYSPPEAIKPKWGTKEWADAQEDSMFELELEGHKQADSFNKWLKGED